MKPIFTHVYRSFLVELIAGVSGMVFLINKIIKRSSNPVRNNQSDLNSPLYQSKHTSFNYFAQIKDFIAQMPILINPKIRYYSFGFIPNGNFKSDFWGKLFGFPNLLKRLQAKSIMQALDIQPQDIVMDFGCGAGYFTVEMAKAGRKAYGIDVIQYVTEIKIPEILKDKLEYVQTSGTRLPFGDHYFDRVLASEVLPMVPDPNEFLREIKRVLKPGGRLVISNGAGHPVIRQAYAARPFWFRFLEQRYPERMPKSYEEYCATLQKSFGTSRNNFLEEADIRDLLSRNGLRFEQMDYAPRYWAGAYISLAQFMMYLRTGKTLSQQSFRLKYLFWSLISAFDPRKYKGGLICVASKPG